MHLLTHLSTLGVLAVVCASGLDVSSAEARPRRAQPSGYEVRGGTFYINHLNQGTRVSYDETRPAYCAKVFWDRLDRETGGS